MPQKFSKLLENGLKPYQDEENDIKMVNELSDVGILTLEQWDKAIPKNLIEMAIRHKVSTTYLGLIRDIMILFNAETYFKKAWKDSWKYLDKESVSLLENYGISEEELKKYLKKRPYTIYNS